MPTLRQTQTAVDAWITTNLPVLESSQNSFRSSRGRFSQLRRTHSTLPEHTRLLDGSKVPDRTAETGQDIEAWNDRLATIETSLPATLQCNVYDGPQGKGWELVAEFIHEETTYRRVINKGPETHRERGWEALDDE